MNKKIFFLILLLFIIFFDNYAFGVIVPQPIIYSHSSSCNCDLTEEIYEKKGEEVVKKECLKKKYLFLNNGKDYCVTQVIVSKRIYFIRKILFWLAGSSVVLLLFLLGYNLFHEEEI